MARLRIISNGFGDQVIELRLGVNRFGRGSANEFRLEHPTISTSHCEVVLTAEGILVRDCGSTNGTFVEGRPVTEAALATGQTLRLGDIEIQVETVEVTVAIPKFEMPRPAPPVVLPNGSVLCPRHPHAEVTHQCQHCHELMCSDCVHQIRRKGGKLYLFCPLCSHACVPLAGEKKRRRSLLQLFQKTVRLPRLHLPRRTKEPE